ncbi:MAG TPA: SMP-30/gluconolactonase/LRE family protein [Egibacteraceae bacterium]|nr:SMP-30/gluconolactonase/LRE family protein [Egibacteraceae bacterium]
MPRRRSRLIAPLALTLALALVSLVPPGALAQEERELYDVRLFAQIGMPGQPEGIAVGRDGTVYVGTHNYGKGDAEAPSKIFAYSPAGELRREYVIQGQNLDEDHGVLQFALDARDTLYVLDRNPPRLFTLDPRTGAQRDYATFDDVRPCGGGGEPGHCSAGSLDLAPFADYPVFAPDGTLYVTDLEQGLIWRVPRGGGEAEVWFTDPRLEGVFGPNGIQFMADGETLLFAQTGSAPPGASDLGQGVLYTLPVNPDGSPGELAEFWKGRPVDGPDGFAIGASGKVYVGLAGASQFVVLSADGEELARFPETPLHNTQQTPPFDTPASLAFHGERVLMTNQSFFTGTESGWTVADIFVGETGLPLYRPAMPAIDTVQPTTTPAPGVPASEGLPATGAGGVAAAAAGLLLLGSGLLAVRRRPS